MTKAEQRRSRASTSWQRLTMDEAEKKFSTELFEDLKSLESFCKKIEKEMTIDILRLKTIFLLNVGSEDMSWIYEVEEADPQYYRQIYLTRDDLAFIFRRMNEKRRIRFV